MAVVVIGIVPLMTGIGHKMFKNMRKFWSTLDQFLIYDMMTLGTFGTVLGQFWDSFGYKCHKNDQLTLNTVLGRRNEE